ncbi:hypothetical protein BH23BAC3_BH23BAC3_08160 [soil metagenome]
MNCSKYTLLYYITTAATTLVLIVALLSLLKWPVVAELALGTALFIHSLILSRTAKDLFLGALEKGLVHEMLYSIRAGAEVTKQNREA